MAQMSNDFAPCETLVRIKCKAWEAMGGREGERETEAETDIQTQTDRDRETERARVTGRQTERYRDRETERDRQRQRQRDRERQRETERQRERERQTETKRQRETETETERRRRTDTDRQTETEGRERQTQTSRQVGGQNKYRYKVTVVERVTSLTYISAYSANYTLNTNAHVWMNRTSSRPKKKTKHISDNGNEHNILLKEYHATSFSQEKVCSLLNINAY